MTNAIPRNKGTKNRYFHLLIRSPSWKKLSIYMPTLKPKVKYPFHFTTTFRIYVYSNDVPGNNKNPFIVLIMSLIKIEATT